MRANSHRDVRNASSRHDVQLNKSVAEMQLYLRTNNRQCCVKFNFKAVNF